MRKYSNFFYAFFLFLFLSIGAIGQTGVTQLTEGGNKMAWVGERVGLTDITIHYNRPGVKGREGKIWGQLVHTGFADLGFGPSKSAPWRAGSNENTTIEFSTDIKIEGQSLKAGKYGFFIAYDSIQPTLIFSKNADSWGSYYYKESEDALRIKVNPAAVSNSVEWLKYEFSNETENSAVISLQWEKLSFPFKVEVDYVNDQIASFRRELRTEKGFFWLAWNQAAQWSLQHNVNLEEALLWTDSATHPYFGGQSLFQPWSTKAQILYKLGRTAEGDAAMKKALPMADMMALHQYGRQLLQQKKSKEALEIFKMNIQKNPGQFVPMMGATRGYSATGDYKNAVKYAKQALALAPDPENKAFLIEGIKKLEAGHDLN